MNWSSLYLYDISKEIATVLALEAAGCTKGLKYISRKELKHCHVKGIFRKLSNFLSQVLIHIYMQNKLR